MTLEQTQSAGQVTRTKTTFRMAYAVSIHIRAPRDRIWSLLTTPEDFPRWNSTVTSITGKIAVGEKITLTATIAPERKFKLQVTELVPEARMVWSDGLSGMFRGVRTYALTPRSDGSTDFEMSEVFSGAMLPMIAGSLPDFGPSFEAYASDLKREAEREPSVEIMTFPPEAAS